MVIGKKNAGSNQANILRFMSPQKPNRSIPIRSDIACPICDVALGSLTLGLRMRHVENCMEGSVERKPVALEADSLEESNAEEIHPEMVFQIAAVVEQDQARPESSEQLKTKELALPESIPEDIASKADLVVPNLQILPDIKKPVRAVARPPRMMPSYKTISFPHTKFAVDAFNYGAIPGVKSYFLSHYHSDHYGGLSKRWEHGVIYCSPATARLTQSQLGVKPEWLREVPINTPIEVEGIPVVFCEANHCPGAVVILFNRQIIHTGDFRASPTVLVDLLSYTGGMPIQDLYLDTTYLDPVRKFPSQQSVISTCAEFVLQRQLAKPSRRWFQLGPAPTKVLVLVGTYTIGKERLAVGIANALQSKIFCEARKRRILKLIGDPKLDDLIDTPDDGLQAQVHLCSMSDLSFEKLFKRWHMYARHFRCLIAFQPTGWAFKPDPGHGDVCFTTNTLSSCITEKGEIQICRVPYSEHSSFLELKDFCFKAKAQRIISTVPNKHMHILEEWTKEIMQDASPEKTHADDNTD